ncbi:MAG: alkaline phosphatase family protein [Candidatus Eisenbacteria bacterium]|nr:alkaline phosphatase family protein [Candidatus Eisenbacteria bacterium]
MTRRITARAWQALLLLATEASTVLLLVSHLPGLGFGARGQWPGAVLLPALWLGLANAAMRPLMIAATVPMGILGFATVTTALNCLLLMVFDGLGFLDLSGPHAVVVGAGVLAVVNAVVSTIVSIDEEDRFYRRVIRRLVRGAVGPTDASPGLLVIEIDGLAYTYLQHALTRRWIPALDSLVRGGGHVLTEWNCGVPSQTSSSQAGIMYGNNDDIPAFRWYERERGVVVVSGNARDASELEARLSKGHGLLLGGSSVNNLLSGDADTAALTLSRLSGGVPRSGEVLQFFSDSYCLTRALILVLWELVVLGVRSTVRTVRDRRASRGHGALYPLQRAISTVVLRDLSTFLVVRDIIRGVPAVYVSYIGYDVVAHERGPASTDAMGVLSAIDRQIGRLLDVVARHGARPYRVVVLSDHGQSPGQSFADRHGITLTRLVEGLVRGSPVGEVTADPPRYLHALLEEMRRSEEIPTLGMARKRAIRSGRLYLARRIEEPVTEHPAKGRVVVCCSGNLAHIYLHEGRRPLCLEDIDEIHPGLVPGVLGHPGVGFVLVRSVRRGPLILGRGGLRQVESGLVEGDDPLRTFDDPERTASQLARLAGFSHCGDIVVNSAVEGPNVFSFEHQCGSHGGLGGPQNHPFMISPLELAPVVHATSPMELYRVLRDLNPVRGRAAG